MNIFAVDPNPVRAAAALHDAHVIKMALETAQILSTVWRRYDSYGANERDLYLPTHANHPCVQWAGESRANWNWLWTHGDALCAEYGYRFDGRVHKSARIIGATMDGPPPGFPATKFRTPFPQCMPDVHKMPNHSVEAYRRYYRAEKLLNRAGRAACWTRRVPPQWAGWLTWDEVSAPITAELVVQKYWLDPRPQHATK